MSIENDAIFMELFKHKKTWVRKSIYIFTFFNGISDRIISVLPQNAEDRWVKMSSIFDKPHPMQKQILYIIRKAHNEKELSYGKCFENYIICYVDTDTGLEMPFIHEEAHMFANARWGRHVPFISEGLAEYIVAKVDNNFNFMHHKNNYVIPPLLSTDLFDLENLMFFSRYDDLQKYRNQGTFSYQMAGSLFFFLEDVMGLNALNKLLSSPAKEGFPRLYFELKQWIPKWIEWLLTIKESGHFA